MPAQDDILVCKQEALAMKCRECGSYVEPGSEYCPECGTEMPVKKRGRRGFGREFTCANCGAALEGGDEICPECGVATGMDEEEDTEL